MGIIITIVVGGFILLAAFVLITGVATFLNEHF